LQAENSGLKNILDQISMQVEALKGALPHFNHFLLKKLNSLGWQIQTSTCFG